MGWFKDSGSQSTKGSPQRPKSMASTRNSQWFGSGSPKAQSRANTPAVAPTPITFPPSSTPEQLLGYAEAAFADGDWIHAEATLVGVVEALAAQSQYSEALGTALCDLSRIYCDNMKWEESRDAATRALGIADVLGYDTEVALSGMSRRLLAAVKLQEPEHAIEALIQRATMWLADLENEESDQVDDWAILPARSVLLCTIAGCKRYLGKLDDAKELDDQFEQLCKNNSSFRTSQRHMSLGRLYARRGKKREALELYDLAKSILRNRYSRIHPEITSISIEQAEEWRRLGEFRHAEKMFDQAVKGMVANQQCFSDKQVQWCRDHLRDCSAARRKATWNPHLAEEEKKKAMEKNAEKFK